MFLKIHVYLPSLLKYWVEVGGFWQRAAGRPLWEQATNCLALGPAALKQVLAPHHVPKVQPARGAHGTSTKTCLISSAAVRKKKWRRCIEEDIDGETAQDAVLEGGS